MKVKGQINFNSKRILSAIFAIFLLCCAVLLFVGCSSNTPRFIVSISFNNKNYELTYRMNRKYYPQTTNHYLAMIESGFYNDTIIHDFQTANNKMIAGAFSNEDAVRNNTFKDLPNTPISVWADANRKTPINNVVYGETLRNGFEIRNGGFSNEKGAIGTYTYIYGQDGIESDSAFTTRVYAKASHKKKEVRQVEYLHNTVTSMFYFSTTDTALDNNYCVFAILDNNASKTTFNELMTAIENKRSEYNQNAQNNTENFTENLNTVRMVDKFTGRTYMARSNGTQENLNANGIYLPKVTIKINNIRIKNY